MSQDQPDVLASGNLALSRRTVIGVIVQMQLLGLEDDIVDDILTELGLPLSVYDTPDFPLAFEQELAVTEAMLKARKSNASLVTDMFDLTEAISAVSFGTLGLAMMHAPNTVSAIRLILDYPQLAWGHCRLVLRQTEDHFRLHFTMQRPAGIVRDEQARADLISYCRLIDLLSVVRVTEDILGPEAGRPSLITLPESEPDDWSNATNVPCPVTFGAAAATVTYPAHIALEEPLRANPLVFRAQCNVVQQMSLMLADDVPLSEQVRRWLWAYSPPLDRAGVATNLKLSERTLARRLKAEGTSFQALLSEVQFQRASALLARTRLSIAEIGYRLGYAEPAAFTHAFSAWAGEPPSEWRIANGQS